MFLMRRRVEYCVCGCERKFFCFFGLVLPPSLPSSAHRSRFVFLLIYPARSPIFTRDTSQRFPDQPTHVPQPYRTKQNMSLDTHPLPSVIGKVPETIIKEDTRANISQRPNQKVEREQVNSYIHSYIHQKHG